MHGYLVYPSLFLLSFVLSTTLTPVVPRLAAKRGWVATPREHRWYTAPTALMGGVAIFAACSLPLATATLFSLASPLSRFLPLLAGATLAFVLGLVDDLVDLSPPTKLVGQLIAAALLVFFGFKIDWFTSYALNMLVSIFWLVAITNDLPPKSWSRFCDSVVA